MKGMQRPLVVLQAVVVGVFGVDYASGFTCLHFHRLPMHLEMTGEATMHTSLCVVPPEDAWDSIQRARYMAKDTTYRRWPPAIRLFHPFCPREDLEDAALEVANLVEKYKVRPFKVVLNSFAIIPQLEAIEADLEAIRMLPSQERAVDAPRTEAEKHFDQLIQSEENIGRLRSEKRNKQDVSKPVVVDEIEPPPQSPVLKQKKMYDEFNGPCMVCLEPDLKSRKALQELRSLLEQKLFKAYDKFSPTSSIAITGSLPKSSLREDCAFRPLVPIAGFSSVASAVKFARNIKGAWKPLTFTVTDLQFISDVADHEDAETSGGIGNDEVLSRFPLTDITGERNFELLDQFGCDAAVMLIGEELEQNADANEIMVEFLVREGIPGAGDRTERDISNQPPVHTSDYAPKVDVDRDAVEDLLAWLDEDDDLEEGTVVVIGRTHFFKGAMRSYDG